MIDLKLFLALVSFYFVMFVTPGPNNSMLTASGIKFGFNKNKLPQTDLFSNNIIRLPMHNNMTLNDIDFTCKNILRFYEI